MTNKEKARRICRGHDYFGILTRRDVACFVVDKCIEMANWKDQQYADIIKEECNTSYESGFAEGERTAEARFKKYLEKKKVDNPKYYRSDWNDYENSILHNIIDEIINEFFKED